MLKRAFAVAVVGFLLIFSVPPQLFPRDGSALTTSTLFAIVAVMLAIAGVAYALVRSNAAVTVERRAAGGAALVSGIAIGATSTGDALNRVANFAFLASVLFLTIFLVAVTIHALALGLRSLRSGVAPAP